MIIIIRFIEGEISQQPVMTLHHLFIPENKIFPNISPDLLQLHLSILYLTMEDKMNFFRRYLLYGIYHQKQITVQITYGYSIVLFPDIKRFVVVVVVLVVVSIVVVGYVFYT